MPVTSSGRRRTHGSWPRGTWYEADCLWRPRRLIVELDSRSFHDTAAAFEHDRTRDRRLHAEGWHVLRVTWRQLSDEPEALAGDLRALLARLDL
jgi:very-short-patch-repair endonuclease